MASIVVALVSLLSGQSNGPPSHPTVSLSESSHPTPSLSASSSPSEFPVVVITGLSEEPFPPPPSRRYTWSGIESNLPSDASIFVIGNLSSTAAAAPQASTGSQPWLVSPQALISKNGRWTVIWIIPNPPSGVTWSAVAQIPSTVAPSCPPPPQPCPTVPPVKPPFGLSSEGPNAPGVVATATYHP